MFLEIILTWRLEIEFMKIYLAKMAKYQKDAAGFIEFLNSMVKYEKKL